MVEIAEYVGENGQLPLRIDFNCKGKKESQIMIIGGENLFSTKQTNLISTQRETSAQVSEARISSIDFSSQDSKNKSDNSNFILNGFYIGPLKVKKAKEILQLT